MNVFHDTNITTDFLTAFAPYFGGIIGMLGAGVSGWFALHNKKRQEKTEERQRITDVELKQRQQDLEATGKLRDRLLDENQRLERRVSHLEEVNSGQQVRLEAQDRLLFELRRELRELRETLRRPMDDVTGHPVERRQGDEPV